MLQTVSEFSGSGWTLRKLLGANMSTCSSDKV